MGIAVSFHPFSPPPDPRPKRWRRTSKTSLANRRHAHCPLPNQSSHKASPGTPIAPSSFTLDSTFLRIKDVLRP
eukprot:scaffold39142_cov365-Isochrysis_galbana.AAC.1